MNSEWKLNVCYVGTHAFEFFKGRNYKWRWILPMFYMSFPCQKTLYTKCYWLTLCLLKAFCSYFFIVKLLLLSTLKQILAILMWTCFSGFKGDSSRDLNFLSVNLAHLPSLRWVRIRSASLEWQLLGQLHCHRNWPSQAKGWHLSF